MAKKKKLTINEALEFLNEAHGVDPAALGRNAYSKQAIYNAVHTKKLNRFGPRHILQLDADELLKVFGPKKVA